MKTMRCAFLIIAAAIALTLLLPSFSVGQLLAQEDDAQSEDARPNNRGQVRPDGDLIGRLNLTPDQVKQIRSIRQQTADEMRNARQRMGSAQRDLDEAIYADSVDESIVEARAGDLASAQNAVARLRALMELRVRRVLTPEQLKLLREIREAARNRTRQRDIRDNPSAFQERQRRNNRGSDPNGVRPGNGGTPQNPATTRPAKP
jgi:periplasmic protein CpxP/Spy